MKKLFIFAAALALTFTSCGNKAQNSQANADSTEVTDTAATADEAAAALSSESQATIDNLTAELQKAVNAKDAKGTIATLANLETIYKNLVEAGKLEEAKAYGSAIKKFLNDNAESIKNVASGNTTVASLVNGIASLPTSAATTADEAKKAVASDIVNLASPTIAKGATAVATAKAVAEAVENAPATVKAAASAAASTAAAAAEKKVSDEVDKGKEKANKAVNDAVEKANKKANEAVDKAASKALKGLGL